jgi:hypothetical protein
MDDGPTKMLPGSGYPGCDAGRRSTVLTHDLLAALERELHDRQVLSVYIDGTTGDPATKRAWRVELDRRLAELRSGLPGDGADRESFDTCVRLLEARLSKFNGALGSAGWMAFITPDAVHLAGRLPVATATQVAWERGIRASPCLRSLKHGTPVVIALVDAHEVKLFRWWNDELERLKPVRAHSLGNGHDHLGAPPRERFHPGVRGATGHDAAQRDAEEATERMLASAAERSVRFANRDGWILVAGIPRVRAQAAKFVAGLAPGRVLELDAIDVHATEARIRDAARTGASAIRNASDRARLADLIDRIGPNARATLGPETTRRALELGRVRELYITQRFLDEHTADSELAVRRAFQQGAHVEAVSGSAAEKLDHYGGVGARLKFAQPEPVV